MIEWIVLAVLVLCALYVHFRGRVRHKFLREITDHSTFMVPINVLMYAFSRVPRTPYLQVADFPELENLRSNWQTIRDEAIALAKASQIKASDQFNDECCNHYRCNPVAHTRRHLRPIGETGLRLRPTAVDVSGRPNEPIRGIHFPRQRTFSDFGPLRNALPRR